MQSLYSTGMLIVLYLRFVVFILRIYAIILRLSILFRKNFMIFSLNSYEQIVNNVNLCLWLMLKVS